MKFLALSFILMCAPGALLDFALAEWKTDGQIRVDDAYKWLFQATRGGEHAVPSEEMAREWLEKEWKTLGVPQKDEPVWQPLCKDDSIGRLNLRPFSAQGGKSADVLKAFVESSKNFSAGSKDNFISAWTQLGKRLKKKPQGKLNIRDWKTLDVAMKAKNYPAVHHSREYDEARHPAYRIMTGSHAKKIIAILEKN